MCCDNDVIPHTLENCLVHCNLTAIFHLLYLGHVVFVKMVDVLTRRRCLVNVIYIMKVAAAKVRNLNCAFDAQYSSNRSQIEGIVLAQMIPDLQIVILTSSQWSYTMFKLHCTKSPFRYSLQVLNVQNHLSQL